MWLFFAFLGPVLWAASTHIDKYLVEKYFKESDTAVLMVFTAIIGVVTLPFIWIAHPGVAAIPAEAIAVLVASGMLGMSGMLFYLRAIQSEEASVVGPLFPTTTLFSFFLAYVLLGETITILEAFGILLVIGGVLLLSVRSGTGTVRVRMRVVLLMLACTFILALSRVIFKFYAIEDDFWITTFWTFVGQALFGLGILLIPHYFRQFKTLLYTNTKALLAVNAANELINLGGGLAASFASLLAPVALVSAISSTSTLFVFLFGILITLFAPKLGREDLSRGSLLQKGIAACLIVLGVIVINL